MSVDQLLAMLVYYLFMCLFICPLYPHHTTAAHQKRRHSLEFSATAPEPKTMPRLE